MRFYPDHRDNTPLRYIGQVPIYVTTVLTALYVAGLLATTIIAAGGGSSYLLVFSTETFFLRGWIWQIFTCTFVNPPTIYFLLWIYVFYRCGMELEMFFGRRTFLKYYALQIVAIVLALGLWRLIGQPGIFGGMSAITTGFFVGFATLYPNLEWFGIIAMKWVAAAFLAIMALSDLAAHAWSDFAILLAICAVSFGFIRYAKLGGSVELGEWFRKINPIRRRNKFRVLPSPEHPAPRASSGSVSIGSVDVILDKIARDGFASLTQDERDQLEKARDILNRKKH